ncbi:Histone H2A.v [Globodera pallida]|nr:Histone H2A.v [Globodera pallida]
MGKEVTSMNLSKVSRHRRAGILFPVSRVHRKLRSMRAGHGRVAATASVYATAVVEYITAEVIELAGCVAKENKRKRVTPRHIYLAMHGDEELDELVKNATIAGGGTLPQIHRSLLPKESEGDGRQAIRTQKKKTVKERVEAEAEEELVSDEATKVKKDKVTKVKKDKVTKANLEVE